MDELIEDPDLEPDVLLRAVSALATSAGVYLRSQEQADLIPRLEAIEADLKELRA